MITSLAPDVVSTASAELHEYLEHQVETMVAERTDFGIAPSSKLLEKYGSEALSLGEEIQRIGESTVQSVLELAKLIARLKEILSRTKFNAYVSEVLRWTSTEVRKYLDIFRTFKDFAGSTLSGLEPLGLAKLTTKRYAPVVEKLRSETNLTPLLVHELVKELLPRPRSPQEKASGWKRNSSGGGRHYEVLLYDEETGCKIERLAASKKVPLSRIIADAIAAFDASLNIEQIKNQERIAVVNEVREAHIEFQRQIMERDRRIAELEAQIQSLSQTVTVEAESEKVPSTWVEVEESVNRDQTKLLETVETWSDEDKAKLPQLLSSFLETEPQALERVSSWVPEKLLSSSLKHLSFVVQKITGENNLLDEPRLEHIYGCRFVSLQNFGNRWEHWIFSSPDGKNFSVFGRDEFEIEAF